MSHLVTILLWALAATGSFDTCEAVAVSADADASICVAPPPEQPDGKTPSRKGVPPHRRISNGF